MTFWAIKYIVVSLKEQKSYNICSQITTDFNWESITAKQLENLKILGEYTIYYSITHGLKKSHEKLKYFQLDENKNTTDPNLWDAVKQYLEIL